MWQKQVPLLQFHPHVTLAACTSPLVNARVDFTIQCAHGKLQHDALVSVLHCGYDATVQNRNEGIELRRRVELLGRTGLQTYYRRNFALLLGAGLQPARPQKGGIGWYFLGPGGAVLRGIAWYCVVLACPGWGPEGTVLRGIGLSRVGPGRGGIARYCVVLACPGWARKGRYCAVLRGIALSGFADFRDWNLWKALGNSARGGGTVRYCVVLPFPGRGLEGAVLRGIAWYWPVPGGARKGRYCAVLRGIGLSRVGPEGAVLGGIVCYWPFRLGARKKRY